jgi:hypothetical protein
MNTKPTLARTRGLTAFVAAMFASVVAIGIFAAVTQLFLRSGTPMERLVVAERACMHHAYVSEREACMREWPSLTRSASMATR